MTRIDGKLLADVLLTTVRRRVQKLKKKGIIPKLGVVLVGNHKPSLTYIARKEEAARAVGIDFALYRFPRSIKKVELVQEVDRIQREEKLSGLIVQLPLPEPLYTSEVLNAIPSHIDVDCLTNTNLGRLIMNTATIVPPTPGAVMSILHHLNVDLVGKNVTVVGVGALVGKPLSIMFMNARASVTTCNSATKDMKKKCLTADIIVTGVGKKDLLRGSMVKKGAIVIDTGIAYDEGKMHGDVSMKEVEKKARFVTPTPGGVGPLTVAHLLYNTVLCAEKQV